MHCQIPSEQHWYCPFVSGLPFSSWVRAIVMTMCSVQALGGFCSEWPSVLPSPLLSLLNRIFAVYYLAHLLHWRVVPSVQVHHFPIPKTPGDCSMHLPAELFDYHRCLSLPLLWPMIYNPHLIHWGIPSRLQSIFLMNVWTLLYLQSVNPCRYKRPARTHGFSQRGPPPLEVYLPSDSALVWEVVPSFVQLAVSSYSQKNLHRLDRLSAVRLEAASHHFHSWAIYHRPVWDRLLRQINPYHRFEW